ncbi:MAG: 50S ribosomal protein L2 [Candidatus Doudnabacteria bacterium RIFCSPHIGHO2_02_FULL_48_21]|uniref:Large ribosomal subunit protein uL2 n=1 Tax=Candidatus Doudnabacteria bacterium RIFCSPLOWO2_02_FULL_48_13 TaxID=1817845 RepID=A0A1F5QC74_9BACT|nr:ribosomal protein L2 [uncultured bacterium]OGE76239.1 MAG: 50S ribosomal protein L2 [Candidatus Doudnabacteria bacterium RIFCSPHIGHO2_01_48_18]OGE77510.1 MAG: 50S ribosomal protein L2 [Candidatus Doudnabacteria bacterium RIFCSPHIGHO2_01_FULL_48_180]OGE91651.1 MAG: 50S ribosomal protein L2 [Candidatus Doudnabacteria bacterium RIFCSPHIGHO2_12_FULL_47_25]OGE93345.1 MAG: 50S ribosomal protein L2 [Candidatus Doudnabacteria bacterium RIFCSPHIGHO2_02_FULL_48_21]OGE97429.1 MAG: 50S ribosomal protei
MAIKIYKPTTAGRRKHSVTDYSVLTAESRAPRSLLVSKKRSGGRNNAGKITVRHIGGGFKKIMRVVDSKRDKLDIPARISSLEYDPGRSAFLSLLVYKDGEKRYIISPAGAKIGDVITASLKPVEIKPGNRTQILNIPAGTFVHDIELTPGRGGQMAKGAGNYAVITAVEGGMAILKLPSGEIRKVFGNSMATVGQVSNTDHMNVRIGKAGRKRLMGIRPAVRGKVMNPVDHPHGGGEGRNPIGMKYPKTPWGKHALGVHTRKKNRSSSKFIVQRRKK